jgi:hypothetical protein
MIVGSSSSEVFGDGVANARVGAFRASAKHEQAEIVVTNLSQGR